MSGPEVRYIGILNVTPDSFSDGGSFHSVEESLAYARTLISQGASIVDIGGDSTRPGSVCVGPEEEWRRIAPVITGLRGAVAISVDTHQPEVADRALAHGASIINDISGGSHSMFNVVAKHGAKVIVMYSRCSLPHVFDRARPEDLLGDISSFFTKQTREATRAGLTNEQILYDPGMGGFLSPVASDSFLLLRNLEKFREFFPLVLGISRKGFLRAICDVPAHERDYVSALIARSACARLKTGDVVYLRVHSIEVHTRLFQFLSPNNASQIDAS